jgi:hypothetical protein
MTTASDDGAKGPIEFSFGDGWTMRLMLKGMSAGDRTFDPLGCAGPEHVIAALTANPQLRAEVLDALLPDGYWDMAEVARLRAAESELAAERARAGRLRELLSRVYMWRGSGLPSGLWGDLGTELNEPPVASVATAEPPIHCISCGGSGRANAHGDCMACDGTGRAVVVSLEQAAPAAVEQPERMLGPNAKLRAEIVAAAREAGAAPWPWAKFVELLEGRET